MAEYDLTQRMAPSLDCHLMFPLLDFLQERQIHPDGEILQLKMELLMKTHMVDNALTVHKLIFNSQEEPKNMAEKRVQVDARLRELEGCVAPLGCLLQNSNVLRCLTPDKNHNLQILHGLYLIGPEQIQALYEYAKFLFEYGKYSVVANYFGLYILLSTNKKLLFSAMWGKLAAEILMKNWNTALIDLYHLKQFIDLEAFESPMYLVESRLWLMHWSLFIFFNHGDGREHIISLFNQDEYFDVIKSNAPHLLRYLAASFIMAQKETSQLKNFVELARSGGCSYSDPITEFLSCLYFNPNFDDATTKMEKCVKVMFGDPFLGKRCEDGSFSLRDEFQLGAYLLKFEDHCERDQLTNISALAARLNSTNGDGERCTTIQDSQLDAWIAATEPNLSNVMKETLVDDGKRCRCPKNQCSERYCECFSAGLYCGETCTCEECINRTEYEETILNLRRRIESRNPDAFTPDIVPRHKENLQSGGTQLALINARHRRGCGCKKSMCLKNYCDCFQADVKCSNGCRCVGCKNTDNPEEGFQGDSVSGRRNEQQC